MLGYRVELSANPAFWHPETRNDLARK